MGIEYEAKFLDIDYKKTIAKIKAIGATIVHPRKMYQRKIYQLCDKNVKGYCRVRDENGKVVLTSKVYINPKFPEETEVNITGTFEEGCKFFESLGLTVKAFQQTYREKWKHPLAHEITFDCIPGLPMYMEIDCTSEKNLNKLIEKLDLDKSKMRFGAYDATYEEYYGITKEIINNKTESLTIKNILKEIKPTKNKELLQKVYKSYQFKKNNYEVQKFKIYK